MLDYLFGNPDSEYMIEKKNFPTHHSDPTYGVVKGLTNSVLIRKYDSKYHIGTIGTNNQFIKFNHPEFKTEKGAIKYAIKHYGTTQYPNFEKQFNIGRMTTSQKNTLKKQELSNFLSKKL